jgi:hypothetical protein
MAAASAIWYGLLTAAVASVADTIEDVVRVVARLNWSLLLVGATGAIALTVVVLSRRRQS